jgi:mevalonate kinase
MRLDNKKYVAHGKLMLFGEYVVMRGLPALAFPTKFGQELRVSKSDSFSWRSFEGSKEWFSVDFNREFQMLSTNDKHTATK